MWRTRTSVVLGVFAATLILGAAIAYAGWYWNSQIDVEGVDVRTRWTVPGDPDGANNYGADIHVDLPPKAEASIEEVAWNEHVTLGVNAGLRCVRRGIQAVVTYNVDELKVGRAGVSGDSPGSGSRMVKVTVTADGKRIGRGRGELGDDISVRVRIPTD